MGVMTPFCCLQTSSEASTLMLFFVSSSASKRKEGVFQFGVGGLLSFSATDTGLAILT